MPAGIGKRRGPARPPGGLAGWQRRGPAGAWFDVEVMIMALGKRRSGGEWLFCVSPGPSAAGGET